ncbi:MAG: hypothetical protein Q8Q09_02385 [Deltaproteobacteria bacterium]|nr:hypothetical protein [Deltaproteobacteria bacterium]
MRVPRLSLAVMLLGIVGCSDPEQPNPRDAGRDGPNMNVDSGLTSDVVAQGDGASGGDGGTESDGAVGDGSTARPCADDIDCNDDEGCTIDRCVVGRCQHTRDTSCNSVRTGGMGGRPFSEEAQRGVSYDEPSGGLVVRAESRRADYLWIPNVAESTVSKWDANTGTEIARYRVGLASGECRGQCCHASNCNMPSRVVVDGQGDAYVANRGFAMQGTVTKMAAETRDCIDRNGNGMIDTSTGPMDVRPFDQDECVLWTAPVGSANAILRSIAIDNGTMDDPRGSPWVAACGDPSFGATGNAGIWQLDSRTGRVLRTLPGTRCLYGAVVTRDNTLYEHALGEGLIPVNVTAGTVGAMIPLPAAMRPTCTAANTWERTYGITTDGRRVWLSGSNCTDAVGYDTETSTWTRVPLQEATGMPMGTNVGSGITVDPSGRVWAPMSGNPLRLMHWNASDFVPNGLIPRDRVTVVSIPRSYGSSAIGADRAGLIWVTSAAAGAPLLRYNPVTAATDAFTGPNQVYTYTDFTGAVRRLVIGTGTYSEDYETCEGGTYGELYWRSETPAGTSLSFAIQLADSRTGLAMAPVIALGVAPRDPSPINIAQKLRDAGVINLGRFARITVTFTPVSMPMVATPVLRALSFTWRCGGVG